MLVQKLTDQSTENYYNMSIRFNIQALDAFRRGVAGDARSDYILLYNNADGSVNAHSNRLGKWLNSRFSKDRNNDIRARFLKALSEAFGLDGVKHSEGKLEFSQRLLDRLQELLGSSLSLADFGISRNNGCVTSGRPLQVGAVLQILDQLQIFSDSAIFDLDEYSRKFDFARTQLGYDWSSALTESDKREILWNLSSYERLSFSYFLFLNKCLNFLRNPSQFMQITDEFRNCVAQGAKDLSVCTRRFEIFDEASGVFLPADSFAEVAQYFFRHFNLLFHVEQVGFDFLSALDLKPFENLNSYLIFYLQRVVKLATDAYFNAKIAGCVEDYIDCLAHLGTCVEDQVDQLDKFNLKLCSRQSDAEFILEQPNKAQMLNKKLKLECS